MADLALIPNTGGGRLTMTSREIAELTGSTHFNVLSTIRNLVERGVISGNETPYRHPQNGQTYTEFHLTYRDTMVVVSGYSVELRAKIIDRWQELEAAQPKPAVDPIQLLSDPAAMRSLLLGYTEKVLQLEEAVQQLAPKASALDRLSQAQGSVGLREAAALEQVQEKWFLNWLHKKSWIYRGDKGAWVAYAEPRKAGYLEMPPHQYRDPVSGEPRLGYRVRVTPRGLAKVAEMLSKETAVPRTQPALV